METGPLAGVRRVVDEQTQPPDDLGAEGVRAFALASRHVASLPDAEKYHDAVLRFARAVDLVEEVRREWIDHGRPKLTEYSNGALAPHPLVKLLAEAEKDAARAGRALKLEPEALKRPPGRPPGAASVSDRKAPPVVRLSSKRVAK
jgi:hypothetical protein